MDGKAVKVNEGTSWPMLDWSDPSVASPDSISPSEGEPRARYHGDDPVVIKISINDSSIRSTEAAVLFHGNPRRTRRASLELTEASCWIASGWTYDRREKNPGAISAERRPIA